MVSVASSGYPRARAIAALENPKERLSRSATTSRCGSRRRLSLQRHSRIRVIACRVDGVSTIRTWYLCL